MKLSLLSDPLTLLGLAGSVAVLLYLIAFVPGCGGSTGLETDTTPYCDVVAAADAPRCYRVECCEARESACCQRVEVECTDAGDLEVCGGGKQCVPLASCTCGGMP